MACQPKTKEATNPKIQDHSPTLNLEQSLPEQLLKNNTVYFNHTEGNYPTLTDERHDAINQEIKTMIDKLIAFDRQFDREQMGGVGRLEYQILTVSNDRLAIKMETELSDMTARYFVKYYQLDLKNHTKIDLKKYLTQQQIDIGKLNKTVNDFLISCFDNGGLNPESRHYNKSCEDISLGYLYNAYIFNNHLIDIINHHDSFYIADDNHIVIAINSTKFTSEFKINLNTYQLVFN